MFAMGAYGFGSLCLAVAAASGAIAYLSMSTAEFGVTSKRVMIKVGFIRRQSLETLLTKVEGVAVNQGILGRILGYGTIVVNGTGSTRTPFANISEPDAFRRAVQNQLEAASAPAKAAASA
ncbi:MAG: PH domain-containing protein [Anaeromyxobacter sp.]